MVSVDGIYTVFSRPDVTRGGKVPFVRACFSRGLGKGKTVLEWEIVP